MTLILQIKSLAFSFLYGIFFAFTYKYNYRFLTSRNLFFKIIVSFFFVIDHILLYFVLISKINNGILHLYFFFMFILGIIFYVYLFDSNKQNKMSII